MSIIYRIGIHFTLRAERTDKKGYAPIYMLLTYQGEKVSVSTNQKVPVKKWNASQQKVSGADEIAKSINNQIDILRAKVIESVNTLTLQQKHVSLEAIKAIVSANGNSPNRTLLAAADIHNGEVKSLIGIKYCYKTYQYYHTTALFLKQFLQNHYNRKDILLSELDVAFAKNFCNWILLNTKSTNNGMAKHIQRFKKIVNWGVREGWINHNPIASYRIGFTKFDRGFLTKEEVELIETIEITDVTLNKIRQQFLFQVYTGLAHSDLITLEWSHIQYNHEGNDWIIKPRQKTNVLTTVPLLPKAKQILTKQQNLGKSTYIFKSFTNQAYNRRLKILAKHLGFSKRLTSHIARHTFATTITLSKGIPIETVSRMLGHTKISTTQVYSKVTIGKISDDMDKLMK